jgi:murein DD-endopeptidase MepM/ murein hydrolase activator NlpD
MLVPDVGQVRNYRMSYRAVWLGALALVALLLFGTWGTYSIFQTQKALHALQESQHMLQIARQQQGSAYAEMQSKLDAEKKKLAVYARNLGQMQARLLRLDSLGEHLVAVSKLDKNEFDFSVMPAVGGPRITPSPAADLNLDEQMRQMNFQLSSLDTQLSAIDMILQGNQEERLARPHAWPSEGGYLSSRFGMRIDPFDGHKAMHKGVDIANRYGAPVLASARGVVVYAGKMPGYGNLVEVDHGYGYRTRYAHLSSVIVKAGDEVSGNQLLGRVGSIGRSTGPHLHFEVRRFGKALNPSSFLPRG